MEERKTIYLCLAHMSEAGLEQKYVKEAFDTNWVVPMGPNVNAFEKDLKKFVCSQTSNEELGVRNVELFNFELFFNQFIFFLEIDFFNDIVGMAKSPYPVVHVYTVHAL